MIHLLLFFSGALALVYEVLWIRRFSLILGATTPATAATLSAVLLGFTAGSLYWGKRSGLLKRPIRAFAFLELGAGLGALLAEWLIRLYEAQEPGILRGLGDHPGVATSIRLLLPVMVLFPATFFMGGTVPVVGDWLAGAQRRLGVTTGRLYALNTAGAAIGAVSVPFLWLPQLGVNLSYAACLGGSGIICLAALALDFRGKPREVEKASPAEKLEAVPTSRSNGKTSATLAAFSGFVMLALEVGLGRVFAQVHEHSIHSFAVVLAVFLVGLALGSALARECLRRGWSAGQVMMVAWVGGGVAATFTPAIFYKLTNGLGYLSREASWLGYGFKMLWLATPTVLLCSTLGGMAMPAIMELAGASQNRSAGSALGRVLGANTLGSVAGSLFAAFFAPRFEGLWGSLLTPGFLMIGAGMIEIRRTQNRWNKPAVLLCLLALGMLGNHLTSKMPRVSFQPAKGERILAIEEGSLGVTAVLESKGSRRIKLDNYYILGGTASTGDERMQGHIPLLLHPEPKKVVFLGLGTGIMAGASMMHPLADITAVELVPEVAKAAGEWFKEANNGFLQATNVHVVEQDARRFLRATTNQFDVIIGDLVVPWRRGEASLYFSDHFEAARRALAPGGMFCQWLPLFQLSESEFNIIAATFMDVFPETTLWRGDFAPDRPAIALIGHFEPRPLDPQMVNRRIREMRPDAFNPHLRHAAGLWMFFCGRLDPADARFATALRNRPERPWVELNGPLMHGGENVKPGSLFTGPALDDFLDRLRGSPLSGATVSKITSEELEWRAAGADIGAGALLMFHGRDREGAASMRQGGMKLPAEIRRAVLGPGSE